jgi:hypothetical protein
MPANPSSADSPEETSSDSPEETAVENEHMSRAERRAAARAGKGKGPDTSVWNHGKVAGARGAQATRRQYSNRRSGG